MKVLSDEDIIGYLDKNLTKDAILNKFQPSLLQGLKTFESNPEGIVPPRITQLSNNDHSDISHLFMPCISPNEVGIKVISGGPSNTQKGLGFQGCVLILDEATGTMKGILNAKTLTAFRTALASTIGLTKVLDLDNVKILPGLSVFGVGLQAYWHVKLALALYYQIKEVNIINRTIKNADALCAKLSNEFPNTKFNPLSYEEPTHLSIIKDKVNSSSIIFGCSPSTEAIIKNDYINKDPSIPKFISLIGSYKPHMIELDLDLIKCEFKLQNKKIIVDSIDHTLHEAGELIQGDIPSSQLIELTGLYSSNINKEEYTTASNLSVQKLVGLSIMDLSIGKLIVEDTKDEGVIIKDF